MTVNISVDLPTQRRIRAGAKFLLKIADIMGEEDPNEPLYTETRDLRSDKYAEVIADKVVGHLGPTPAPASLLTAPPAAHPVLLPTDVGSAPPVPTDNPGAAMLMGVGAPPAMGPTPPASAATSLLSGGGVPTEQPTAAAMLMGSPQPVSTDFIVLHADGSQRAGFSKSADFVHVLKVEISETMTRDALAELSKVHEAVYARLDRGEKTSVTRAFNGRRDELIAMERSGAAASPAPTTAADGPLLPWVEETPAPADNGALLAAPGQAPLLQPAADPLAAPAVDPLAAPAQETRPQLSYPDFEAQFRPQALVAGVQVFREIFAECCPAGAPPGINTISPDKYWRAIDMVTEALAKNGK